MQIGIEETVGREIDELLKPGKTVADVEAAYRRMNAIGAGTHFWRHYTAAFNDVIREMIEFSRKARA